METGNSQTPDVTDSSNAPPLLVLTVNSQSSTETFAQKTAFRLRLEQGKSELVNLEQEHGPRGEKPHAAVTGWMVPPPPTAPRDPYVEAGCQDSGRWPRLVTEVPSQRH